MSTFLHSIDNKPLVTPEDFYEAHCQLSTLFMQSLKPTPEEVQRTYLADLLAYKEDLLSQYQLSRGDIGLLACLIYERREAVKEEELR